MQSLLSLLSLKHKCSDVVTLLSTLGMSAYGSVDGIYYLLCRVVFQFWQQCLKTLFAV